MKKKNGSKNSNSNISKLGQPKLKDEAFEDLERLIVNGELAPGQWVSETDLIDVSNHTRASVRSAIQRLADTGLVTIVPRRGAQICPLDYTQQFRSLELRRVVEVLVARCAAKRASEQQKKSFLNFSLDFKSVAKSGDQEAMTEIDSKYFAYMLEAADNSFAARALASVKGLSRRFWVLHQENYGDIEQMALTHAQVASAISKGNPDEAEQAVGRLIDYVEKFTLEAVGFSSASIKEVSSDL